MKKINRIVYNIEEDSIATEVGIEIGDTVVSINNVEFYDILEYKFLINDDYVEILIRKNDGQEYIYEIEKEYNEDIGIIFEEPLIDCGLSCHNKCIFCFIDQLPKDMRQTLYFKDDDYRLSFLQGNYVTLTNISDNDIDRIIKYKISPINVSVHTTDPELRIKMLNNKSAGKVMGYLKKLVDNGITVNAQIVLCPDVNDKHNLDKTIKELSQFYPSMQSVSVVPVGITKFRKNLFPMKPFDFTSANELILQVEKWQLNLKEEFGTSFIFIADEFYVQANKEVPGYEHYENFPQIENGVGLIAQFKKEFDEYFDIVKNEKIIFDNIRQVSIVTGASAYKFIKSLCDIIELNYNIKINLFNIKNDFFGETVTVTGLVTGNDIIKQLSGNDLGEILIVPDCMLRSGETVFLDDVSIEDIKNSLNINIIVNEINAKSFIDSILGR